MAKSTGISRLPFEVVANIFAAGHASSSQPRFLKIVDAVHVPPEEQVPYEILVSHVTQRWRAVALSTPILWSLINVPLFNPRSLVDAKEELSAYLERGKQSPLRIHVRVVGGSPSDTLLQMLTTHISRWRQLYLTTHDTHGVSVLQERLTTCAAPILEHLSICNVEPYESTHSFLEIYEYKTLPSAFLGGVPKLSSIRLDGMGLFFATPPLHHATSIILGGSRFGIKMSAVEFSGMFSLPSLINLSVTEDGMAVHVQSNRPVKAKLPNLRSLRLRGSLKSTQSILSCLEAPLVESLAISLRNMHNDTTALAADFPALKSLTLGGDTFAVTLSSLSLSNPWVEHLSLRETCAPFVLMHSVMSACILWPNVRTLTLVSFKPSVSSKPAEDSLAHFLSHRKSSQRPITKLRLGGWASGVMKVAGLLRDTVEVEELFRPDDWQYGTPISHQVDHFFEN